MSVYEGPRAKDLHTMDIQTIKLCGLRNSANVTNNQWVELVGEVALQCFDAGSRSTRPVMQEAYNTICELADNQSNMDIEVANILNKIALHLRDEK